MKPITINYPERTITLSSAFERKAFTPGTAEYAQLMEVRHEFPDFRLATRQFKTNTTQDRYKGLTYDYMRWYIGKAEGENAAEESVHPLEKGELQDGFQRLSENGQQGPDGEQADGENDDVARADGDTQGRGQFRTALDGDVVGRVGAEEKGDEGNGLGNEPL